MKAITLWQPWASLVALGVKTIETRSWSTIYRGPLAIHAAKRPPEVGMFVGDYQVHRFKRTMGEPDPPFQLWTSAHHLRRTWTGMPLGAVVATCELVDVVPMVDDIAAVNCVDIRVGHPEAGVALRRGSPRTKGNHPDGEHIVDITDQVPYGDFARGRFAWILDNIAAELNPLPARGRQQLWEWAA